MKAVNLSKIGRVLGVSLAALAMMAAASSDPAERLSDPAKEARARALFKDIRCLVCQNESIDDSEADLAGDLRRVVRSQIVAGRSDAEIKRYLESKYGQFVLLRPPFDWTNAALWAAPFGLLVIGGAVIVLRRRRDPALETPLSPEEAERLKAMTEG